MESGQPWTIAIPAALATLAASVAATRGVLAWLHHQDILDHPNERSSHTFPTPRGGGLAVTPVMAAALVLVAFAVPGYVTVLAAGALILMAVSWLDDRRGLPPLPRFLLQAAVIAAYLLGLEPQIMAFSGLLPLWADRLAVGLGWLWFVNLYNFMDGIDGITGVETTCLGLGIALVSGLLAPQALVVAAAGLGFLVWNWHPARIFLGDSGSIPLGFVLGGLLIQLAGQGNLTAALILPGYYIADASITLLWRMKDGEKIWQPHKRHFYQRAIQGGKSHSQVSSAILGGNVLLIGCAILAAQGWAVTGSILALMVVAGLLTLLRQWARP